MNRSGWMRGGLVGGLVAGCVWAAGAVAQEESTVSVGVDVPVLSSYVWRGQVLNDDAVLQPGLTAGKAGFTVNAWSSMNLNDTETDGEFTEMDWTVSYSAMVGPVSLGAGVVQYTFPNSTLEQEDGTVVAYPGTYEVFASAGLPDVLLSPTVTVYRDLDEIDGFYGVLAVAHSFSLSEKVGLKLSASLGAGDSDYNSGYFGHDEAALNDCVVGAALPISVIENLSVTPSISYMLLPDSDLGDAAEEAYGEKDSVYGGVTLSYAF